MEKFSIEVKENDGIRIDKFICSNAENITRSSVQNLIKQGNIKAIIN
jgi:RNA-binding protein YlmH